jgi:hypothetical protein
MVFPAFYGNRKFKQAGNLEALTYGEEFLAPSPTPKLEDHPLSAVRNCLFSIFAATVDVISGLIKLYICKQRMYVVERGYHHNKPVIGR